MKNAEKILDLNSPSSKKYFQKQYDYIFDGGSLDNIFSPSNAIINLNKMLKKKWNDYSWQCRNYLAWSILFLFM